MKREVSLKVVVTVAVTVLIFAILATSLFYQFYIIPAREGDLYAYNQKLSEIEELVDKYYVGTVDKKLIIDGIAAGYVDGLQDKYGAYMNDKQAEETLNSFYGLNSGIGIQISAHPDNLSIYVLDVHKGSPAATAGLQQGDEIIKIDNHVVSEYGYSKSLTYIKSVPTGETIHLTIMRKGKQIENDVVLTQYTSQSVFYRLINNKGYIQITTFNKKTVEQFKEAVDTLIEQGADALVFDLRGNGGGLLTSVYNIVDYVIPKGLALRVEYKDSSLNETYFSDENEINIPMAILTDKNTASASELFSQALKDYNKAITVGRVTYGKGVVQRNFSLSDGSLVRITVAKYYTQNGTCLDGIGVIPDIAVELTEEEAKYRLVNGIEKDKDFIKACEYLDGKLQLS